MDTGLVIALVGLALTIFGGGATWLLRFGKAEAAADQAEKNRVAIAELDADFAEFRERVARDYATAAMVAAVEGRVVSAIDRLADRLDRILESRPPATRTPRSTK